ncbi:MAG: DNA polymerase III subunit delta [Muribaculaceae bacterium]|nr:DNA polymerase III subunit delta [Muribaculaceae bacterium]
MSKPITFEALRDQLRRKDALGSLAPIYVLHGAEGYFIDELTRAFENLLPEEERDFNQYVLYAPQTSMDQVVDVCRRFPMMSEKQVVVLKEMQSMRADQLDHLARYVAAPSETTVFVMCSRGEKVKGAKLQAALRKAGDAVVFESVKISDSKLGPHITGYINGRGLNVQPKALEMLRDYIGADLSRMYNELDKLITILGAGATVTPEAIEQHIGVSKDYNAFELVDALSVKDYDKAMRIVRYFRSNPKAVPTVMATAAIFGFFSDLLVTYFVRDKSPHSMMQALNLRSEWQLKRFDAARRHYNAFQAIEVIRAIRQFDVQTKGVGSRRNEYDLMEELVFRIVTAPGNLFPKY